MIKNRKDIELMSPVGSFESLMAAIQGGADSVYFGVEKMNMRANSSVNFTLNDLKTISGIAKENNLKTYLTINTVIYDNEIEQMKYIVDAAKENKISAIIASDLSVINYARSINMEVHISTQVNVSNIEAVKFYSRFADVMVLARELNLDQVSKIAKQIEEHKITGPAGNLVKLEIFVHGALCMAISGKCYLSLHEQNYSANRGACLQTCRKSYIVTEKESGNELEIDNEYIMSPKDLCTIGFLDKLIKAGVGILKIEGRARSPEYVKTVSRCYHEAICSIIDATYSTVKIESWVKQLSTVFNRGFWDGYYLGSKLGEWNNKYGSVATKRKIYIGKVTNYFAKLNVAEILMEAGDMKLNDEIIIIGPTTGVIETRAKEIRFELKKTDIALKGQSISIPVDVTVRRSDKLYKLVDSPEE